MGKIEVLQSAILRACFEHLVAVLDQYDKVRVKVIIFRSQKMSNIVELFLVWSTIWARRVLKHDVYISWWRVNFYSQVQQAE